MSVSIFLDKFEYNEDDYWLNYPKGYRLNGAYMFFEGSTHLKAGLLS